MIGNVETIYGQSLANATPLEERLEPVLSRVGEATEKGK